MDINDFFDPNNYRQWLRAPFNIDGRTCATNGYILLTMPQYGSFNKGVESITTGVRSILESMKEVDFKPMPFIEMPEKETCNTCNGEGKALRSICEECDGEGEVDAETDYNTYPGLECKTCKGDGETITQGGEKDCQDCHGIGKRYNKPIPVELEGMYVSNQLLSLIINDKDVQIGKIEDKDMLAFRSGDQTGVIIGMRA